MALKMSVWQETSVWLKLSACSSTMPHASQQRENPYLCNYRILLAHTHIIDVFVPNFRHWTVFVYTWTLERLPTF